MAYPILTLLAFAILLGYVVAITLALVFAPVPTLIAYALGTAIATALGAAAWWWMHTWAARDYDRIQRELGLPPVQVYTEEP